MAGRPAPDPAEVPGEAYMGAPTYHRIVAGRRIRLVPPCAAGGLAARELCGSQALVTLVEEHLPKYPSAMRETTEEREAIDTYFVQLKQEAELLGREQE